MTTTFAIGAVVLPFCAFTLNCTKSPGAATVVSVLLLRNSAVPAGSTGTSIAEAEGEWILWLNPDEELLSQAHQPLRAMIASPGDAFGYLARLQSVPRADRPEQFVETWDLRLYRRRSDLRYVGRLHPSGIVFAAILMSMFYIGGELAQSRLGLPKSLTGVFQGLLLFTLLACDTLIAYRIRLRAPRATPAPPPAIDDAAASPVVTSAVLPAREGT